MNNTTQSSSPSRTPIVGDILASTWGYEQTNVDFYQVIKVTKASVVLIRMGSKKVRTEMFQGVATPNYETFGEQFTRRFKPYTNWKEEATYGVSINSYESAKPWDGKPVNFSDGY